MLGAIVGDIISSRFEAFPTKRTDFDLFSSDCRFIDDTVLTVAVADWLLNGGELHEVFHDYFDRYPAVGYACETLERLWRRPNRPRRSHIDPV